MTAENIIKLLPYNEPFLFVDTIEEVNDNFISGSYTYKKESSFYAGHFKDFPVTPGVILIETMAQIGVVCLGIYLLNKEIKDSSLRRIAMTSAKADFFLPVFPGEKVTVKSDKIYFRFGKLKCEAKMFNGNGDLISSGEISGMIKSV